MLFNSYTFVIFFAVVLVLHNLALSWRARKFNLLLASYVFYAAWNPPFVILLWISTVLDWFCAKGIGATNRKGYQRALMFASLLGNLGLLGFYKYAGFVLDNFVHLMSLVGVHYQPAHLDIILPVGISFYTFQTLSYTLDVYRGNAKPSRSFLDYALYVTFFPQLVAGPIIRATDFLPQCDEERRTTGPRMGWGLCMVVLGLFEKIVISDGLLASIAEKVYATNTLPGTASAWAATLAFSGQIFCDFAGYSTCAIGVATCLGFDIQNNFRFPYAAIGFSDFWTRWHISLSSWLKDYLYIPLGGNRKGSKRTYVNLSLTMLLGGLWHGASWTFVVWGGLHGAYLIVERLIRRLVPASPHWERNYVKVPLALGTYGLVLLTWVFFRASSFTHAFNVLKSMVGISAGGATLVTGESVLLVLVMTAALLAVHWHMRDRTLEGEAGRLHWFVRAALLAAMLVAIVTLSGEDRAFIYFQF